jgi:hypothetical protein
VKVGTPSDNFVSLQVGRTSLKYPENWQKYGQGANYTVAPEGGIVDGGKGNAELAYGVSASLAKLEGQPPDGEDTLHAATEKLLESMRQENEGMEVVRTPKEVTLNGERALSTFLRNESPEGGKEIDWVVTVLRPEGLINFVCVAPETDYARFQKTFESILDSVRFQK